MSLCQEFEQLKNSFEIIFEHNTQVPGLADSLKHFEGFFNICRSTNVMFQKGEIFNSRSATTDCENPAKAIGLSDAIDYFSQKANYYSKNAKNIKYFDIDFNKAVSGISNAHDASRLVCEKSYDEKIADLKLGIINQINSFLSKDNIRSSIEHLQSESVDLIKLRFVISHVSVIDQFVTSSHTEFKNKLKDISKSRFEYKDERSNTVNIVVHFRLGDTKVFTCQNGQMISAWGDWRLPPTPNGERINPSDPQYIDFLEQAPYKQFSFDHFIKTIKLVNTHFREQGLACKFTFISDGFSHGIDRLESFSNQLKLSSDEITYLRDWANIEESSYKEKIRNLNKHGFSIKYFIGESKDSLIESVASIANADILIKGVANFSQTIFDKFGFKDYKTIIDDVNCFNKSKIDSIEFNLSKKNNNN